MIGRLRDRHAFARLRAEGVRASAGPLTVVHRRDEGEWANVAYAIGRRVGPAVERNRLRRRLRAQLRARGRDGAEVPSGDYLVIVRPAAAGASSAQLRAWLDRALKSINKKESA